MMISSAEIGLTLCHLSILEKDAPVELLRDAVLFGKFSHLQQMEFCQHCYRIRKTAPRSIDYSMKVLVQVRCDQNPKGNLSPDIKMCSYVEEVL